MKNIADFPAIIGREIGSGATRLFDVAPDPFFLLINLFQNKLICFKNKLICFETN